MCTQTHLRALTHPPTQNDLSPVLRSSALQELGVRLKQEKKLICYFIATSNE